MRVILIHSVFIGKPDGSSQSEKGHLGLALPVGVNGV